MARLSRRVSALVAALALAGAGIAVWLAVTGDDEENGPTRTPGAQRPSLENLEPAWSAPIEKGGVLGPALVQAKNAIVVSTEKGVFAYAKDCGIGGAACDPLWIGDISPDDPAPAVSEELVFEATDEGLFAFELDCGSEGATCRPLWTAPAPSDSNGAFEPVVSEGVVKVNYSFGEGRKHEVHAAAFSTSCGTGGDVCRPLWTALVGKGSAYFPAPAVGGTFFQQVGQDLVGFDAGCGTGGERCRPSFLWPTGGEDIFGPVQADEEILATSASGSVYAFPSECAEPCRPLWTGETGGYIPTPPVVAADTAYVSEGPNVHAFRLGCRSDGGECPSDWTATVEGAELVGAASADQGVLIVATLKGPGSIWAFPADCAQPCRPLWTADAGARLGRVEVADGTVFVGTYDGGVRAYPTGCATDGSQCPAEWSAEVPGKVTELFVDALGVYVLSFGGEDLPHSHGTLTAFRVRS